MEGFGQESWQQAAVAVDPSVDAGPSLEPPAVWDRRVWLVAIPLAFFVIYAFIPVIHNGFVLWDDKENFLENPYFRGLAAAQVKWAWTTFWVGAYQPLAWSLYGAQYVVCQLNPRGYHLTSLLLQVANVVVLYVLTVALLVRCQNDACLESPWTCSLGAGLATALFAVHPLRVEAVAWASAQMYLPCILFSMLSVLAYLRAFGTSSSPRWGWLAGSFVLFVMALLFHALPVTLPVVLLVLDVYPLRRLGDVTGRWFGASARRILWEKVPFIMTSLLFMALAIAAKPHSLFPFEHYGVSVGIARACYAIWFYLFKTMVPLDLIVFYPLPRELNWLSLPFALSIFATLAISAGLFLARRRWPGPWAAWLCYLVILAPNSGIIWINNQIAADRYSYMPMLGSVVLAAAGFCWLWRMSPRWHPVVPVGILAVGLAVLIGLIALTRDQCRTWLDSETLWAHALAHGANTSWVAHNSLGQALVNEGKFEEAKAHFTEAMRLNPGYDKPYYNLGNVLYTQGKYEESKAHYTLALRVNPGYAKAHYNLGVVLNRQGKYQEAVAHYAAAARLDPRYFEAHYNLAIVLNRLGRYEEGRAHYNEAVRLNPGYAAETTVVPGLRSTRQDDPTVSYLHKTP